MTSTPSPTASATTVATFASVRLLCSDLKAVVAFYEAVTGVTAAWLTEEFAEVAAPGCALALGSERTMALFGAGAARPAANATAILEFRVGDVDADFARLGPLLREVVQAPTTQPWGNRSLLFRDPEGTLVNLFTPVSEAAKRRYGL